MDIITRAAEKWNVTVVMNTIDFINGVIYLILLPIGSYFQFSHSTFFLRHVN